MLFLLFLAGCATKTVEFAVPEGPGEKIVALSARSFAFEPNLIVAKTGDQLLLMVTNRAGINHNLTVRGPDGMEILDRELPRGETVEVLLELTQPGEYEFVCGKPFHSAAGMQGKIVARP